MQDAWYAVDVDDLDQRLPKEGMDQVHAEVQAGEHAQDGWDGRGPGEAQAGERDRAGEASQQLRLGAGAGRGWRALDWAYWADFVT